MKVIIGSWALNYADMGNREPKDLDIWYSENEEVEPSNIDGHIIPIEILKLIPTIQGTFVATPNAIYTIKCSHLGWDIKWEKHKSDVIYLKAKGCELILELYSVLVKHWEIEHGDKSHLSLNKSKEEFFNDNVKKIYDHDLLHEIVARPNRPVYESVLKENEQVLVDKNKFSKLPKELQIKLFREEIKVIALERYLIPSNFRISKLKAYFLALKKTITNLTKNWATQFIVENLYEFSHMGNDDWLNNFLKHTGQEINMSYPVIEKLKNAAEKLEIDDDELQSVFLDGEEPDNKKFAKVLKGLNFKHLHQDGAGIGGTEYCEAVIELSGQAFKLEYSYYSQDGYNVDDIWAWKLVTPKTKTVTYYE